MRPIDADKLEVINYKDTEGRENTFDAGVRWMAELIDKQPTVDAVPVMRCKDCKWCEFWDSCKEYKCWNVGVIITVEPDGYCSRGEPKEEK